MAATTSVHVHYSWQHKPTVKTNWVTHEFISVPEKTEAGIWGAATTLPLYITKNGTSFLRQTTFPLG